MRAFRVAKAPLLAPFMVGFLIPSCVHRRPSLNPLDPLKGYQYAFPVPRNDYEPGTVIVRWSKPEGKINVVCRGSDYMPPNGPPMSLANSQIAVSSETTQEFQADMNAKVKEVVDATIRAQKVTKVSSHFTLVPLAITNDSAAGAAAMGATACQQGAKFLKSAYGKNLKDISLIYDVAKATFDYDIDVDTTASIGADALKKLEGAIGGTASLGGSSTTTQKIKITGAAVYTNYNLSTIPMSALEQP